MNVIHHEGCLGQPSDVVTDKQRNLCHKWYSLEFRICMRWQYALPVLFVRSVLSTLKLKSDDRITVNRMAAGVLNSPFY
jgi:hypothetical protein